MWRVIDSPGQFGVKRFDAIEDVRAPAVAFGIDAFAIEFATVGLENNALRLGAGEINAESKHNSPARKQKSPWKSAIFPCTVLIFL